MDYSCQVLAKFTVPQINAKYSRSSRFAGVFDTPTMIRQPELDQIGREIQVLFQGSRYSEYQHLSSNEFWPVILEYLLKVEDGELSPDQAASGAIDKLEATMRNELIVIQ